MYSVHNPKSSFTVESEVKKWSIVTRLNLQSTNQEILMTVLQDSNLQSSDPLSTALSIRPHNPIEEIDEKL